MPSLPMEEVDQTKIQPYDDVIESEDIVQVGILVDVDDDAERDVAVGYDDPDDGTGDSMDTCPDDLYSAPSSLYSPPQHPLSLSLQLWDAEVVCW